MSHDKSHWGLNPEERFECEHCSNSYQARWALEKHITDDHVEGIEDSKESIEKGIVI